MTGKMIGSLIGINVTGSNVTGIVMYIMTGNNMTATNMICHIRCIIHVCIYTICSTI